MMKKIISKLYEATSKAFGKNELKDYEFRKMFFKKMGGTPICADEGHSDFIKSQLRDVIISKSQVMKNPNLYLGSDSRSLSGLDLSGLDLHGVDLSGLDLSGCIMKGTNLSRANLSGCNLSNIWALGADFEYAILSGAKVFQAKFFLSSLKHTNFRNAEMIEVDLNQTNLFDVKFYGAKMSDILFTDLVCPDGEIIKETNISSYNPEQWKIFYGLGFLAIGCHQYTYKEWLDFTDEEIESMHTNALEFWKKHKDTIFDILGRAL